MVFRKTGSQHMNLTDEQTAARVERMMHRSERFVPIDVPFGAVSDMFRSCDRKTVRVRAAWGIYWRQHLLWRGEWWCVGQTDLCDDVATGLCAETPEQAMTLEKLLSGRQYGVRFHRWHQPDDEVVGALSVITHMTDG